ncbi:MAG TPA: hypothetical protein VNK41_03395 [Vicinamibacterales bacterium]|nr:hypothetical protein [Vicinamibacterales bacterium]
MNGGRGIGGALIACLLAALPAVLFAAERHALVLTPPGMPVRLERATFFDDGRQLTWVWRNGTTEPLYPRFRVFVFDGHGALLGSLGRCTTTPLQPGTREQVRVELEVKRVTSRHRFVAVIEEVRSTTTVWRVERPGRALVEAAQRAVRAEAAALDVVTQPNTDGDLSCACECETAEALGREGCGPRALEAFTCTPAFFPSGCSLAYTCRGATAP